MLRHLQINRLLAIRRYGIAVLGVILATGVRLALTPYVGDRVPYVVFYFAVIPAAWRLGLGPSLLAVALSTLTAASLFVPPLRDFGVSMATEVIGTTLFVVVNLIIIWFAEVSRIDRRRLECEVAERIRAESIIVEQVRRAEFGRDLGLALTSGPTLALVLDRCVTLTEQHLGGDLARIEIFDESRYRLGSKAGKVEPEVDDLTFEETTSMVRGLLSRVASERRPLLTNNLVDDSGFYTQSWAIQDGMIALAACPLVVEDHLIGVWTLFSRGQLAAEVLEAMESFASALALGIERKRAEENLRIGEARKTAILETSLDGIITMNHQGKVVEFNPAAEQIFGISAASIRGRDLSEIIMPKRFRASHHLGLARYLETGESEILDRRIEVPAVRADGTEFPVELAVARIPISGSPMFTAHVRDISDRTKAEEALRSAKRDAEDANQAKDRFIAVLSHELRTPLNPISLTVNSILKNPNIGDDLRLDLESIQYYLGLEARLIDDLLDVMRITRGEMPLLWEVVDAHHLVRQAARRCAEEVDAKSLQLTIDLQAHHHLTQADPNRLRQVFWNLVKNATKFTPIGGSITLRSRNEPIVASVRQNEPIVDPKSRQNEPIIDSGPRQNEPIVDSGPRQNEPIVDSGPQQNEPITDSGPQQNEAIVDPRLLQNEPIQGENSPMAPAGSTEWLVIEVSDDGIGIDPQALPKIFEAFQQGEASIHQQFGGLGLGLAICHGVVKGLGGSLSAHSEGKGQGTTFTVRLWCHVASSTTSASAAPATGSDLDHSSLREPTQFPLQEGPNAPATRMIHQIEGPLEVLVVEDEPTTIRLMSRLIRGLGYKVTTAETIAEASMWVDGTKRFDLIVSDIGLPDGTGLDLMRRIRATRGMLPGIALTGYGTEEDIEQSRLAGFSAHMTKPIDFNQLETLIRRVVSTSATTAVE